MRCATALVFGGLFLVMAASTASAEVQLSIRDGRVTLVATDATVRQILTEWARVGQTRIVNVDRIPGGPVTLQLTEVPESEALDLLLRSVTGYMAANRSVPASNLSRYDRILVLPTAAVARVPVAGSPAPVFQQSFPQPQESDDGPSIAPPRGPLFQTFPTQGQAAPPPGFEGRIDPPPGAESPNAPPTTQPAAQAGSATFGGTSTVGTPRPGMVTPVPAQRGGQPGQTVSPNDN